MDEILNVGGIWVNFERYFDVSCSYLILKHLSFLFLTHNYQKIPCFLLKLV